MGHIVIPGVELIMSDAHTGLQAARKVVFGGAPWQRCQFHLQQNAPGFCAAPGDEKRSRRRNWLVAHQVDTVAIESTGVYWIPVFERLEARGLTLYLVNGRHVTPVPGRTSDVQDGQWLQKLHALGRECLPYEGGARA